jgi:hypothetical protein
MYQYKNNSINEGLKDVLKGKENIYTSKNKDLNDAKMCTRPWSSLMIIGFIIARLSMLLTTMTKGLWRLFPMMR